MAEIEPDVNWLNILLWPEFWTIINERISEEVIEIEQRSIAMKTSPYLSAASQRDYVVAHTEKIEPSYPRYKETYFERLARTAMIGIAGSVPDKKSAGSMLKTRVIIKPNEAIVERLHLNWDHLAPSGDPWDAFPTAIYLNNFHLNWKKKRHLTLHVDDITAVWEYQLHSMPRETTIKRLKLEFDGRKITKYTAEAITHEWPYATGGTAILSAEHDKIAIRLIFPNAADEYIGQLLDAVYSYYDPFSTFPFERSDDMRGWTYLVHEACSKH